MSKEKIDEKMRKDKYTGLKLILLNSMAGLKEERKLLNNLLHINKTRIDAIKLKAKELKEQK